MVPIWIIVGCRQSDRQHDQKLNNDTFYRPPIISCQSIIGIENYPDSVILMNYNDDEYSERYAQINEAFRVLSKDDILKPYISDNAFRSTNDGNN